MHSIDKNLRLHDGNESRLLADPCVPTETVHGLVDGVVGGTSLLNVDAQCRTPLGELGSLGVVFAALVVEVVEAGAPGLAFDSSHQGFESGVDLDARDDAGGG